MRQHTPECMTINKQRQDIHTQNASVMQQYVAIYRQVQYAIYAAENCSFPLAPTNAQHLVPSRAACLSLRSELFPSLHYRDRV